MKNQNGTRLSLNFHLFAEGGDGGGDSSGGLGPEASAFMDSISNRNSSSRKEPESKPDLSNVQYGRSKGEGQARQVGSDNAASGQDLQAEFAALVGKGGKYHDIYGQRVSGAIQDRLKNQADLQGQVDSISQALSPVFQIYGVKSGDLTGLASAIAGDEDLYIRGAERDGLDLEQYKANLKLKADAERGRQITEAYERQQKQNEMFAQWEAEAAELQQMFPNFDLGREIQSNEQFAKALDAGVDVRTAFAAAHMEEIMNGSRMDASRRATDNVINTIQARASRPAEAGLRHSPAIQRKTDPSTLSNADMDEIMRRVEDGETFSF